MRREIEEKIKGRWDGKIGFLEEMRDLTLSVEKSSLLEFLKFLKDELSFVFLIDLTAVDWPDREKRFEIVYWLSSMDGKRLCVKVSIQGDEVMPSIVSLWKIADWYEREVYDMFGIKFDVNKKRILLPDDWKGFPLKKDYPLIGELSSGRTPDSGSVSRGSNPRSPI